MPALDLPGDLAQLVRQAQTARPDEAAARQVLAALDFTSLNADDTEDSISGLCNRAVTPAGPVAGVCIYAPFVPLARRLLTPTPVRVVTVVNFPAGGADAARAADEARTAVTDGAQEIDVVFPYTAFLRGNEIAGRDVVAACREVCGDSITLKVILESGQVPSVDALAEISRLAIAEGADFLKTSTGKRGAGASLEAAAVMLDAIREADRTIGFKPSGGVRTLGQSAQYLKLVQLMLGDDAIIPSRLRFGASSLMRELLDSLGHPVTASGAQDPSGY